MTVSMLWHICFCQLIENLLEVKFVVGRSGPIDVRHRVVLYDAALSPRKRSVAAEASEGTKGGERPVWSYTVDSEGEKTCNTPVHMFALGLCVCCQLWC